MRFRILRCALLTGFNVLSVILLIWGGMAFPIGGPLVEPLFAAAAFALFFPSSLLLLAVRGPEALTLALAVNPLLWALLVDWLLHRYYDSSEECDSPE